MSLTAHHGVTWQWLKVLPFLGHQLFKCKEGWGGWKSSLPCDCPPLGIHFLSCQELEAGAAATKHDYPLWSNRWTGSLPCGDSERSSFDWLQPLSCLSLSTVSLYTTNGKMTFWARSVCLKLQLQAFLATKHCYFHRVLNCPGYLCSAFNVEKSQLLELEESLRIIPNSTPMFTNKGNKPPKRVLK